MSGAQRPDVSVVMSVYNGASTLPQTIDSVLAQAGCTLEFVIVDDGSTDDSAEVLEHYRTTDARVRVIRQQNTGLTRALAVGCAAARAEFIARHDAGDVSLPDRLAQQLGAMRGDTRLVFVSCATRYVEPLGAFLYTQHGTGAARHARDIVEAGRSSGLIDGPSHHGSVMFRTDAYRRAGGYRPEFYFGQDWDLWYRLAQHGHFQMLDATLYQATLGIGDISTTHRVLQEQLAGLSLQALQYRLAKQSEAPVLAQAALVRPVASARHPHHRAKGAYFLGECLRRNGDIDRARAYFLQALQYDAFHLKSWVRLGQIAFSQDSDSA